MKLSSHNARVDSAGLHNDRNFDISYAPHIDGEKTAENKYWTYNGETEKPLNEIEFEYYQAHFSKYVNRQNELNRKSGHSERNRTIKQFFKAKHTRPEDKIIQIGDKNEHPDPELLWECALEYQRRFSEIFGSNCKILDMSLHVDEATPHIHIRRVWTYEDERGIEKVGQTRALEQLGIMERDTSKGTGRFNNSKITFTAQERELIREICKEKGIELEADAPAKRKHLSVPEYKELAEDLEELERTRSVVRQDLEEMSEEHDEIKELCGTIEDFLTGPVFYNIHDQEVAEARKKSLAKRAAELTRIMKTEADKVAAAQGGFRSVMQEAYNESQNNKLHKEIKSLNHKVDMLNEFIVEKGLSEEFVQHISKPKEKTERTNDSPHRNNI